MIDHPAVAAVRAEKHKLYAKLTRPIFTNDIVERLLRVEYDRIEAANVMASSGAMFVMQSGQAGGPLTIEGVTWYEVPRLPSPGWRVINPMRRVEP